MYTLDWTEQDVTTLDFVGYRYRWSAALRETRLNVGQNQIPEHVAWELREAFEADTEGGHSPFPMLDPHSDLYQKLINFWDSIV